MAGDDQTLGEILGVDEASHSTWQELVGGILLDAAAQKPEAALAPVQITVSDPLAWVDEQIRAATGRQVGNRPVWVRFFRPAQDIGALFVLSAPHPVDGADLVMVANRGMITRGLIRDLCRWAFYATGLSRVVVRIPVERADLQDYARRAGLANGLTTQGGASQSYGNALSALGTGQGNMQASILGQGAALQQGLGNQFNALINNSTGALVSNNNALAASQTKASENALGAIVGLGKSVLDFNPFKGL